MYISNIRFLSLSDGQSTTLKISVDQFQVCWREMFHTAVFDILIVFLLMDVTLSYA